MARERSVSDVCEVLRVVHYCCTRCHSVLFMTHEYTTWLIVMVYIVYALQSVYKF